MKLVPAPTPEEQQRLEKMQQDHLRLKPEERFGSVTSGNKRPGLEDKFGKGDHAPAVPSTRQWRYNVDGRSQLFESAADAAKNGSEKDGWYDSADKFPKSKAGKH